MNSGRRTGCLLFDHLGGAQQGRGQAPRAYDRSGLTIARRGRDARCMHVRVWHMQEEGVSTGKVRPWGMIGRSENVPLPPSFDP